MILEWDIFYPLPDSWRKPKKPTPKPPPPPPPPTTTEEIIVWDDPHADHDHDDHSDHHSDHSEEAWMPEGGWQTDDVLKNLADEKEAERRYWNKLPVSHKSNSKTFKLIFYDSTAATVKGRQQFIPLTLIIAGDTVSKPITVQSGMATSRASGPAVSQRSN